jgi:hypothetical protein
MKYLLAFLFSTFSAFALACVDEDGICTLSDNLVCGPSTEITKFGGLGNSINVYIYIHTFGEGKRAANRLIFVKGKREYLGMYSVNDFPVRIENECLVFQNNVEDGTTLCLNANKLPEKVHLDGEISVLFK